MKKIIILFILLNFSISVYGAENNIKPNSEEKLIYPFSIGALGFGYISTSPDSDLLGSGGGAGINFKYNVNKYFALGVEGDMTASRNGTNSTTFGGVRFLLIAQNETERDKNGFVPWGAFALGTLMGNGSYENGTFNYKNFSGFDISLMIGLRYNYKRAYFGIGADFTYGETIAEVQAAELYPNQDFFIIGTNIFLEAGYRF